MGRLKVDEQYMLHEAHETQQNASLEISHKDISILRDLGKKYAEIAALPIQQERKALWQKLNDMQDVRPLVWINEICWEQMDVDGELTVHSENEVAQRIETFLRRTIYQWKHMQGDMVIPAEINSPLIIEHSGIGIKTEADYPREVSANEVISRHFYNQIQCEEDIEKITIPTIKHNRQRSNDFYQLYKMIFDGILNVRPKGSMGFWFSPWDDIVFWMGADQVLLNLAIKPNLMLKLITHVVDVYMKILDQYEELNLLGSNNCNWRVGSGAYGYTNDLPQKNFNESILSAKDLWGSAAPQIFGSVSPKMHEEFSLAIEMKYLKRFGLTYYGCCEPLSDRLDLLNKITNLRKISISPWANTARAAEGMRGKYVMSLKPSPALFAASKWDQEYARKELETKLIAARGCNIEVVMKDISTVLNEPQRLWEWAKMVEEIVHAFN